MRGVAPIFIAAFAVALLPTTSAQSVPLTSVAHTLFVGEDDSGNLILDSVAHGSGGNGFIAPVGAPGAPTNGLTGAAWDIPLTPELAQSLSLDATGNVVMTAHMGELGFANGLVPVPTAGPAWVSAQLLQDSTVVADGPEQMVVFTAAMGQDVSWSVHPAVTAIAASGGNLHWSITAYGPSALLLSYGDKPSTVVLPITAAGGGAAAPLGPKTHYGNLTSTNLAQTQSVATNDTYIYNVTNTLRDLDITFKVNTTKGSVHLIVTDAAKAIQLDRTVATNATGTVHVANAGTGKWQYKLVYSSFKGFAQINMVAHGTQQASAGPSSSQGTSGPSSSAWGEPDVSAEPTASGDSGAPASASSSSKKVTPGFEAVSLVGILGLAAVLVARRR